MHHGKEEETTKRRRTRAVWLCTVGQQVHWAIEPFPRVCIAAPHRKIERREKEEDGRISCVLVTSIEDRFLGPTTSTSTARRRRWAATAYRRHLDNYPNHRFLATNKGSRLSSPVPLKRRLSTCGVG